MRKKRSKIYHVQVQIPYDEWYHVYLKCTNKCFALKKAMINAIKISVFWSVSQAKPVMSNSQPSETQH